MKKVSSLFIFMCSLFVLLCFSSCNDDGLESFHGDITGIVKVNPNSYNQFAFCNDIVVILEGTNFAAITNKNGFFSIENVPAGTYNIVFNNDTIGYTKYFSFQHLGGPEESVVPEVTIYQQPQGKMTFFDIKKSGDNIEIDCFIDIKHDAQFILLINDEEFVDEQKWYDNLFFDRGHLYSGMDDTIHTSFSFKDYGFIEGDKLYYKICLYRYYPYTYFDYEKREDIDGSIRILIDSTPFEIQ